MTNRQHFRGQQTKTVYLEFGYPLSCFPNIGYYKIHVIKNTAML